MNDTYAFRYEQANLRGAGFGKKLVGVREPGGVWRDPKPGATYMTITNWLIEHGWAFKSRSSDRRALATTTEVWHRAP